MLGRKLAEFRVSLDPTPSDRPRNSNRHGVQRTYETARNINFRREFRQAVEAHRPETPHRGPIAVEIFFWMRPPKKINYEERPFPGKPDIDNLEKSVLDAMNPTFKRDKQTKERVCMYSGFWADDAQVVDLHARKFWATEHDGPGIWVALYEA